MERTFWGKNRSVVSNLKQLSELLFIIIVGIAATLQLIQLVEKRLVPSVIFAVQNSSKDGFVRGAQSLEGEGFAGYVEFLRNSIPETASVMLPPRVPVRPVAHLGLMQYFLFPRELHNCGPQEVEACIRRVNEDPKFFILGLSDFPPPEIISPQREYVPYNDDIGLFLP